MKMLIFRVFLNVLGYWIRNRVRGVVRGFIRGRRW